MKLNFCTLFDSNYLSRGIALYHSLEKHTDDFHLYIFVFDAKALEILGGMKLTLATIISLAEFEDAELLAIKQTRSVAEYCWTCTPSVIWYSILKYNLDSCTYLDADLKFYGNPELLIAEMGQASVLITDHRYSPEYDQTATSGKYCVQFMTFRNTENGMKVLKWWRDACINWCYARFEDGKFGDQKYLDDWATRFAGVHESKHLGGGVAPWNLQQYDPILRNGNLFIREKSTGQTVKLIFFHFHYLKYFTNGILKITDEYKVSRSFLELVYMPYLRELKKISGQIKELDASFDSNGSRSLCQYKPHSFRDKISIYRKCMFESGGGGIRKAKQIILDHNYFYLSSIN